MLPWLLQPPCVGQPFALYAGRRISSELRRPSSTWKKSCRLSSSRTLNWTPLWLSTEHRAASRADRRLGTEDGRRILCSAANQLARGGFSIRAPFVPATPTTENFLLRFGRASLSPAAIRSDLAFRELLFGRASSSYRCHAQQSRLPRAPLEELPTPTAAIRSDLAFRELLLEELPTPPPPSAAHSPLLFEILWRQLFQPYC